jgi:hypothetical protein
LACDLGINYFDTAIFYCSEDSQRALGEAMEGRRSGIVLSTKNNFYKADQPGEWRRRLEDSLRLLRTDYLDIYNFHGLNWASFNDSVRLPHGLYREMERAREEGLIRHICCSFHDEPENLVRLAETGLFASFTLQYNLIDRSNEAGIRRLSELGCGIVIMGPVAGGRLGDRFLPHLKMPAAEVALRFVLGNPAVNVALSGMESELMLRQNVATVETLLPGEGQQVPPEDHDEAASAAFARMRKYYCTACRYCLPCPQGVAIPENMTLLINDEVFELSEESRSQYARMPASARRCTRCKRCLPKCPQKLEIDRLMARAVERFDPDYGRIAIDVQVDQPPRAETMNGALLITFPATLGLLNLTGSEIKDMLMDVSANDTSQISLAYSAGPGISRQVKAQIHARPNDAGVVQFSINGAPPCSKRFLVAATETAPLSWSRIDAASNFQIGDLSLFAGHAMRFAFCAGNDHLTFHAVVTDDCLGCAPPTPALVISDCVELYLAPGTSGKMHGLFLFPGARDGTAPYCRVVNTPLPESEIKLTSRFTSTGYELNMAIPYAAMGIRRGDFLKTDIILNSADTHGKRILAVEFGHAPNYWSDPAGHPLVVWG